MKPATFARLCHTPITHLNALVVPVMGGGQDSHGKPIADDEALLRDLRDRSLKVVATLNFLIEKLDNELPR